jgi:hypothetical protein
MPPVVVYPVAVWMLFNVAVLAYALLPKRRR